MRVFFTQDDYRSYKGLLAHRARHHKLDIWAYCLMPNHVHLIVVPSTEHGLARPLGEAHQRYALLVNKRFGWTGHLWQERFASFPMDEPHLMAAIRYVLLNPVRAGLARSATDWPHSSARAHVCGKPDSLVNRDPASARVADWGSYLKTELQPSRQTEALAQHGIIGRPLGSKKFIKRLEGITRRRLRPHKVGRKQAKLRGG